MVNMSRFLPITSSVNDIVCGLDCAREDIFFDPQTGEESAAESIEALQNTAQVASNVLTALDELMSCPGSLQLDSGDSREDLIIVDGYAGFWLRVHNIDVRVTRNSENVQVELVPRPLEEASAYCEGGSVSLTVAFSRCKEILEDLFGPVSEAAPSAAPQDINMRRTLMADRLEFAAGNGVVKLTDPESPEDYVLNDDDDGFFIALPYCDLHLVRSEVGVSVAVLPRDPGDPGYAPDEHAFTVSMTFSEAEDVINSERAST